MDRFRDMSTSSSRPRAGTHAVNVERGLSGGGKAFFLHRFRSSSGLAWIPAQGRDDDGGRERISGRPAAAERAGSGPGRRRAEGRDGRRASGGGTHWSEGAAAQERRSNPHRLGASGEPSLRPVPPPQPSFPDLVPRILSDRRDGRSRRLDSRGGPRERRCKTGAVRTKARRFGTPPRPRRRHEARRGVRPDRPDADGLAFTRRRAAAKASPSTGSSTTSRARTSRRSPRRNRA